MADETNVDVVVVGLGPGGQSVATQLVKAGLSVLAVHRRLVGGECPYYGCIPSKMIRGATLLDAIATARRVPDFGGTVDVRPDYGPVHARIRDEVVPPIGTTRSPSTASKDAGAEVVHGDARLVGSRKVEVNGINLRGDKGVVLNTGPIPRPRPSRARGHAVLDKP